MRVAVALLALLLPAPAAAQSIRITAPTEGQHFDLGANGALQPILTAPVTFSFAVTGGVETDRIGLLLDAAPPVLFASAPAFTVPDLACGPHLATAFLVDGAGRPYDGAVDIVRFALACVCDTAADCPSADPCAVAACVDVPIWTGLRFGSCRYAQDPGDPDCCLTGEWCRHSGLVLRPGGFPHRRV